MGENASQISRQFYQDLESSCPVKSHCVFGYIKAACIHISPLTLIPQLRKLKVTLRHGSKMMDWEPADTNEAKEQTNQQVSDEKEGVPQSTLENIISDMKQPLPRNQKQTQPTT